MIIRTAILSILFCFTASIFANESDTKSEVDAFWKALSRTIETGDAAGYRSLYHDDAVVVLKASGESYMIDTIMKRWLPDFEATAKGAKKAFVEDRFEQRILNADTAWESGIYHYWTIDKNGIEEHSYTWFESLLVKKNGDWLITMELQERAATIEEWQALLK